MRKAVSLTIIALLLAEISALTLPMASSISAEIYVYPNQNVFYSDDASIGFRFNVTVWVKNVSDLASWQVQMNYNSTMLNCTRTWQPSWDTQYVFFGKTTFHPPSFHSLGYVVLGDIIVPWNQTRFAGTGKLCTLEFQVITQPRNGAELSCILDITQSDYGTYLLDSNNIQIPEIETNGIYKYINRLQPISNFDTLFASNADVHMVYPSNSSGKPLGCSPAMTSDWTASAFVYPLLNHTIEGFDIDPLFVNQTNGKPQGSNGTGVISFGGPIVNLMVFYAENTSTPSQDKAPIIFHSSGGICSFQYANGTDIPGTALNITYINNSKDVFVIEMFKDMDGKYLMLCYGFGWKGTYAAGKYFYTTMYPNLQAYAQSWSIVSWEDTNGNGFVDTEAGGDSYVVVASGS